MAARRVFVDATGGKRGREGGVFCPVSAFIWQTWFVQLPSGFGLDPHLLREGGKRGGAVVGCEKGERCLLSFKDTYLRAVIGHLQTN